MKKTDSLTVVLVTAKRLARADFEGPAGGGPGRLWSAPARPGCRTPEAVGAALALGGKPARRVLVLYETFWAQSVVLNTAQAEGLSQPEIAQALGYELEPFSNVSPADSAVGFRELTQKRDKTPYWVVQAARGELGAIRDAVASAGGRLVFASHPAGLPAPVGDYPPGTAWQRLELWPHGAVLVSGTRSGDAEAGSCAPGGAGDLPGCENGEMLFPEAGAPAPPGLEQRGWTRFSLDEKACLLGWLRAWAACLESAPRRLALLVPGPAPTPLRRYAAFGLALEFAAAAFCLGHGAWYARQRDACRREAAAIAESVARIAGIEQENGSLARSVEALGAANRTFEESARRLALQRHALPALLRSLGTALPPGVVIRDIRDEGGQALLIGGLSMTAGGADDLLTRLAGSLPAAGWTVSPLRKEDRQLLDGGGPWRFELRVSLPAPGAPAAAGAGPDPSQGGQYL